MAAVEQRERKERVYGREDNDDVNIIRPVDLPPHLHRMCETQLLTHEQEATLFREMNLLKHQANGLRSFS